jgi:hypothetical protein
MPKLEGTDFVKVTEQREVAQNDSSRVPLGQRWKWMYNLKLNVPLQRNIYPGQLEEDRSFATTSFTA